MVEICWSSGRLSKKYTDMLAALNESRSRGLNGRISVKWPTLDILMVDGTPIAYKGDLGAFSIEKKIDIVTYEMSDPEMVIESNDQDYIKLDSLDSLLSLIREVRVKEGVILNGKLVPVIHLFEPSSIAVSTRSWGSYLNKTEVPVSTLRDVLSHKDSIALNIVSITDRWVLDIVMCNNIVIGASLSMPEQVSSITGADAFNYPLESPGLWLITYAEPLTCPSINFVVSKELFEKARNVVTGVVKL